MIAYVDSSVLLRKLFGEPGQLEQWSAIKEAYASRLVPVEVARTIDRYRLAGKIGDEQVEKLHGEARKVFRSIEILAVTEGILERAASAMPTVIGTLDAIHLATALELAREPGMKELVLATHDVQLARAARASGLQAIGA